MIRIAAGSILLVLFLSTTPVRAACSGDVNGDHQINVADVFYLINDLFAGGPAPVGPADVNLDMNVNVSDVFYLINYLFAGGPSPVTACAFGCDVPAGSCADLVPANQ